MMDISSETLEMNFTFIEKGSIRKEIATG